MSGNEKFTDEQLADARAIAEKETDQEITDEEMIRRFGHTVPRAEDSDTRSGRTIHVDEPDTGATGRHARPKSGGVLGRLFRGKS